MKKIFFCLLIFGPFQSFSQISIGFTGGFIAPLQHFPDSSLNSNAASKLGIELIVDLNTRWKIRTGIEYVSFTFSNYTPNLFGTRNVFHAQYLSIPIGLRYVFNGTKLKPFIDGSMSCMGNIGHSKNTPTPIPFNPTPNSFVLSPALNVGVLCTPSNKIYMSFMVGYAMQMEYVYKVSNNNQDQDIRCNGINGVLTIGYSFR